MCLVFPSLWLTWTNIIKLCAFNLSSEQWKLVTLPLSFFGLLTQRSSSSSQTHFTDFWFVFVQLCHILAVLLLVCFDRLETCRLGLVVLQLYHLVDSIRFLTLFIIKSVKVNLNYSINVTLSWISFLAWSALTFVSFILTRYNCYLLTNLLFWRSKISRSAPYSWFLKAFASTAAWFSFINCRRWFISLSYLFSFSCSYLFCYCFKASLFLNSSVDFSFACSILWRSYYCYFFFFCLSSSFIRECSARLFIIISFLEFIDLANSSFFLRFSSLLSYSSRFLSSCACLSLSLSSCKDIYSSSPKPIVSAGFNTLGLTFTIFYSSLIYLISSFFFSISTWSYYFFFSRILFISSLPSSCTFLFFYTTFYLSTWIFSFFSFTSSTNLFFASISYSYNYYLSSRSSLAISFISWTSCLFCCTFSWKALMAASRANYI